MTRLTLASPLRSPAPLAVPGNGGPLKGLPIKGVSINGVSLNGIPVAHARSPEAQPGLEVRAAIVAGPAPLIRMAFLDLLQEAFSLGEQHEALTLEDATRIASGLMRPLIIIDAALMPEKARALVSRLIRRAKGSLFVLYGTQAEIGVVSPWLSAGFEGVLDKRLSREEIRDALQALLSGQVVVRMREKAPRLRGIDHEGLALCSRQLRPRHKDVLRLIGQGLNNKDIALTLGLRVPTVKHHTRLAMSLLQVATRTQAALCCNWMSARGLL